MTNAAQPAMNDDVGPWAERERQAQEEREYAADPLKPRPFRPFSHGEGLREVPHNIDAEAALLGALMIENRFVGDCGPDLKAEHFYEPVHGEIFTAIRAEVVAGRLANPVTLRPRFMNHPTMEALGGPGYLAKLTGSGVALIGVKDFAFQIVDLARRRQLIRVLQDSLDTIADGQSYDTLEDVVANIDAGLADAIRADGDGTSSHTIARAWDATMTSVDALMNGERETVWKIDGLADWNSLLGGMAGGDLIVLAGRPGMGKTAVALRVATCAARAGIGVDLLSYEMSTVQLMGRVITDLCYDRDRSTFTYQQFLDGKLNATDRQRIDDARTVIESWPLRFHEPKSAKIGYVLMEMRRRKRAAAKKGQRLDVFVIDYLQLLRGDRDRDNKNLEISEITRDLKLAAKELGVAIILLSQLSRQVEQREDKRPQMSDLRDSGSIEQDADAVVFVYREEYYLEASEPPTGQKAWAGWSESFQACRDQVELIARKVRRGKTGSKKCQFFLSHQAIRGSKFFSEGY